MRALAFLVRFDIGRTAYRQATGSRMGRRPRRAAVASPHDEGIQRLSGGRPADHRGLRLPRRRHQRPGLQPAGPGDPQDDRRPGGRRHRVREHGQGRRHEDRPSLRDHGPRRADAHPLDRALEEPDHGPRRRLRPRTGERHADEGDDPQHVRGPRLRQAPAAARAPSGAQGRAGVRRPDQGRDRVRVPAGPNFRRGRLRSRS